MSRDGPFEKPSEPRDIGKTPGGKPKGAKSDSSSDSDDSVGPTLPGKERSRGRRPGPSIPSMEDLELKKGIASSHFLLLSLSRIMAKTM